MLVRTYGVLTTKLGPNDRPLSLALLSDLHGAADSGTRREILQAVERMQPDVILLAGDMMTARPDLDLAPLLAFLSGLAKMAPVFSVNGNHETKIRDYTVTFGILYQEYVYALETMGIRHLENKDAFLTVDGIPLHIYGYELPHEKYRKLMPHKLTLRDIHEKLGNCDSSSISILLTHNPAFAPVYYEWGADLIAAGHYHGGLIRIGDHALLSPYGFPFPRFGYGQFMNRDQSLVVSGGAGDHSVPLRIANPREIVQIILDEKIVRKEAGHGYSSKASRI